MVKRKNFLPTFLLVILFWLIWGFVLFRVPPTSLTSLVTFHLSLFLALFLTLSLVLANSRQGFLLTTGIIIFLILRFLKIAHFLNLALLIGVLVTLELYLRKR